MRRRTRMIGTARPPPKIARPRPDAGAPMPVPARGLRDDDLVPAGFRQAANPAASNDAIPGENLFADAFPTRGYPLPTVEPRSDNRLETLIGGEVRAFRIGLGMTLAELATASGLSLGMLSKIENGGISPSLTTLLALSKALGVAMGAFFVRYDEERHPDCGHLP